MLLNLFSWCWWCVWNSFYRIWPISKISLIRITYTAVTVADNHARKPDTPETIMPKPGIKMAITAKIREAMPKASIIFMSYVVVFGDSISITYKQLP
jgi:hypothetical protein